ncbi:transcription factor ABORTED MICROSPORES-like isoform X2 [Telopea speciosissima]|uniref:transcription factor ABORTED MICROSPORES-like isoform X2 n=1 Tax=Telopea speciosissima TaxID=54955 RepID=UPI001CC4CDB5|nr:transcription factor ABORTED MICROSPORES-like isoform X2 [Telopea speciosissima]
MGGGDTHHTAIRDMSFVQSLLRHLVGLKGWDYGVFWKLAEDQRFIDLMGCCCGGTQNTQNGGEELLFHGSPVHSCRDIMFQHPRTKACDLLVQLPSSLPLDPGIYADTILSNQSRWMNVSNSSSSSSSSNASDVTIWTKVLIPVTGGLIELFVAEQVPEDQEFIHFVMAQCNFPWEQTLILEGELRNPAMADDDGGFIDQQSSKLFHSNGFSPRDSVNNFAPLVSPTGMTDNLNLPWEFPAEQIRLCNSPMSFFGGGSGRQHLPSDNRPRDDIFFEGSMENGFQDINVTLQQSLVTSVTDSHPPIQDFSVNKEAAHDKDTIEPETGHANSVSDCSDQIEEGEEKGRRHQSKNLDAERKRRKKLNDRLYALRALVPKISKMDRASILGDAIEFVKELQKKVKDLQDELEEPMEEDGNNNLEASHQNGPKHELDESMNKSTLGMINDHGTRCSSSVKMNDHSVITDDKAPKMEPLVEVTHIGAKEFFLRVFCEQKPGGFVKLMEAMNAMGLEVINVNVITFRKLVLNIFKVEKRDNEMVQAEHVRESLLEITRNPIGDWPERP